MSSRWLHLTSRQVNLLLELLVFAALLSGLASWIVPLRAARLTIIIHAIAGLSILVVTPLKIRGSVKSGFKRRRRTRHLSSAFGLLVLVTIALGLAHALGLSYGVGYWTALWTHQLFGYVLIPLLVWHVITRPVRPSIVDMTRRGLVSTAALAAAAATVLGTQEVAARVLRLDGADREGTGSHDTGSFDPDAMPAVQWINDTAPPNMTPDAWPLRIEGEAVAVAAISRQTKPLLARLDCTGGWYADQNWDVVSLADLLPDTSASRSIKVTSATGYARIFSSDVADRVYVCTGYDGRPLRRGHGAPIRIIAPGRRGPWWVKWVTEIELTDRPSWLQLPLPPT